jgi:hypothetical protein
MEDLTPLNVNVFRLMCFLVVSSCLAQPKISDFHPQPMLIPHVNYQGYTGPEAYEFRAYPKGGEDTLLTSVIQRDSLGAYLGPHWKGSRDARRLHVFELDSLIAIRHLPDGGVRIAQAMARDSDWIWPGPQGKLSLFAYTPFAQHSDLYRLNGGTYEIFDEKAVRAILKGDPRSAAILQRQGTVRATSLFLLLGGGAMALGGLINSFHTETVDGKPQASFEMSLMLPAGLASLVAGVCARLAVGNHFTKAVKAYNR